MVASPQIAEQTMETFQRAAEICRGLPARQGNVVRLTSGEGDEAVITADVHGNRRNFRKILRVAALDDHPRRHLMMQEVCHGGPTYPGGTGCMSHIMLEDVARLTIQYPGRFHFILSNHELAELTDFPILKGRRMLNLLFRCGLQAMYGDAAEQVRAAAQQFIRALPLALRLQSGVFVAHSLPAGMDERGFDDTVFERAITEEDLREGGAVFRLVWGRDYGRENADAFAEAVGASVLITGHEPCPEGFQHPSPRHFILDCCGENAHLAQLSIAGTLTSTDIATAIRPLHGR